MFDHITLRVDDLADASEYPPRHDYRLTDMGRDLWPVLTTMRQWGDKYAAPDGPPLELIHERCGRMSEPRMICSSCGEPIGPRDVTGDNGARRGRVPDPHVVGARTCER